VLPVKALQEAAPACPSSFEKFIFATMSEIQSAPAEILDQVDQSKFKLIPVRSGEDREAFVKMALQFYRKDPNYIRPLDKDIHNVFDESINKTFRHGRLERWLLKDTQNNLVGRVAAFVNDKVANGEARKNRLKNGGMGFFECIDDQQAANTLFEASRLWNIEQGMECMDGPINFGERNSWWGLLVEGFDPPTYQMNYHPPYYKNLFEQYGWQDYFQQYSYGMLVHQPRPKKYYERAERIRQDPDYSFRHVDSKQLDKFADDFAEVFNGAFAAHAGRKMENRVARKMFQKMKPVMVDYLSWFGYYKEQPISLWLNLPEINQYYKRVNGKMDLLGKLKFALHHHILKSNHKFFGLLFGVVKDFQGKGVEGAMIMAGHDVISKTHYKDIELTWIGDFNPKMIQVANNLGANIVKKHITYRYIFDPQIPFERHPRL
jgi:hypothetical protein